MTPEEKAVIDAAVSWRGVYDLYGMDVAGDALLAAIDALLKTHREGIVRCEHCNADGCERCNFVGEWRMPLTEWMPATFADVLTDDRIRIGAEETTVLRRERNQRLWLDLEANPGLKPYPPGMRCQILCDETRKASLLIQQTWPRTDQLTK